MSNFTTNNILSTQNLSIGYDKGKKREKKIARDLSLKLHAGEFVCLLGANGSGKSTLMRTIAKVQPALAGKILLDGAPIHQFKPAHIARKLSLVLTDRVTIGNLSVYTLVSLGRVPYTGWLGKLTTRDKEVVDWALHETETAQFAHRNIDQLSDGERQKVMIARALAQDTSLILLDEPTAHLDLPNRVMIFKLLRKLAKQTQKAILLTTHELDLALQAADNIWLMGKKSVQGLCSIATGTPEDLVLNGVFEKAFQKDGFYFDKHTGAFKINESARKEIRLQGKGIQAFWTQRALEREGYTVVDTNNENVACEVVLLDKQPTGYGWQINDQVYSSVAQLLKEIAFF
ncbi:ABC transporter ATP-binding protein [uncultured Microscilla sp.]|uniref:ABC transporter ATP-binding protein n=1 Tax=uncultured Microscilla sp. TaxID=432653 RepID=UPI0026070C4B|nr:ABC transporter ATP-binding protein [uncultured Microscilla sp.]